MDRLGGPPSDPAVGLWDAPAPGLLEPLLGAAEQVVAKCTAELAQAPPPQRAARLHYEIAQAHEGVLGDFATASDHYAKALEETADHVPSIRGARRVLTQLGRFLEALPLFEAELRVTPDSTARALLQHQKGRFLQEFLGDDEGARNAHADALELDPTNPTILKAVERAAEAARDWRYLAEIYRRAADAVKQDPHHRAALIFKRAQLLENELADPGAAELYALALELDPEAVGVREALVRICGERRDWNELVRVLGQSAERSQDPAERALTLYRLGRVHSDRLGNQQQAVTALAEAMACAPTEPLVLDDLARLYAEVGDHEALAQTLRKLVDTSVEVSDRVALLHTLGDVYDKGLHKEARGHPLLSRGPGAGSHTHPGAAGVGQAARQTGRLAGAGRHAPGGVGGGRELHSQSRRPRPRRGDLRDPVGTGR